MAGMPLTEGSRLSAPHRISHVLGGFTWRPPSVEERQLAMGKVCGASVIILAGLCFYKLLIIQMLAILPPPKTKQEARQMEKQLGRLQSHQASRDDRAGTRPLRRQTQKERQGTPRAVSDFIRGRHGQLPREHREECLSVFLLQAKGNIP